MLFVSLRASPDKKFGKDNEFHGDSGSMEDESASDASDSLDHKPIRCAFCQYSVTDISQRITVNGSYNHAFANPHGLVFEIGCFRECTGAMPASAPSIEFSWFSGYSWQVAVCRNCNRHLGWRFLSGSGVSSFYGMIIDNLLFP
ncbi:conserved hypothetical protein [Desulfamplus magnetovallimortis]|uniref:CULT domain-containing protein n=1 Tax=Desulfamplus magnetovallimortis TaxID=1246637 RepID=A0A1W1HDH0_9BACT|nr:cereblon family protein [Desulfamplus magnetovallimortis]SLM30541.1 conserved hypothetical protein [Desulfamplus magnetovallimortis]